MNNIKLGANLVQSGMAQMGDVLMIDYDGLYTPYMVVSDGDDKWILVNLKTGNAYSSRSYNGMTVQEICDNVGGRYVGKVTITIERA